MIIPRIQTGTRLDSKGVEKPVYGPDYSVLTEEQRDNVYETALTTVDGVEVYEVTWTEKYQKSLDKAEMERIKAENKLLRDRIAGAADFAKLKEDLTKIKDSETNPEKWQDKSRYLQGQRVEHKGIFYLVLVDHESDKAKEPDVTPEWYEPI